jgi:hypothetical protein
MTGSQARQCTATGRAAQVISTANYLIRVARVGSVLTLSSTEVCTNLDTREGKKTQVNSCWATKLRRHREAYIHIDMLWRTFGFQAELGDWPRGLRSLLLPLEVSNGHSTEDDTKSPE